MIEGFKLIKRGSAPNDFINNVEQWEDTLRKTIIVKLQFDVTRYALSAFEDLAIPFHSSLSNAVPKRQAEFLAGRFCAKACLQRFPQVSPQCEVPIGKHRQPIWPIGVVGSITHSNETALCTITDDEPGRVIGIDTEVILTCDDMLKIGPHIYERQEERILASHIEGKNRVATLIFSAKESLFKAVFPAVDSYFGFEEARVIRFNAERKSLTLLLSNNIASPNNLPLEYTCFYDFTSNGVTTIVL